MTFTYKQGYQALKKAESMGWDTARLTQFGQASAEQFRQIEAVLDNIAEITRKKRLRPAGSVSFGALKKQPVIKDGEGVYLYSSAESSYESLEPGLVPKSRVEYEDLTEKLNDFEIMDEIENDSVHKGKVGRKIMWANIARLMKKQADGQSGDLLNDGKANIFYYEDDSGGVRYVIVNWFSGDREWHVYSNRVNDRRWDAGRRVLRNCGTSDT